MSQENIEIVRSAYAAMSEGDLDEDAVALHELWPPARTMRARHFERSAPGSNSAPRQGDGAGIARTLPPELSRRSRTPTRSTVRQSDHTVPRSPTAGRPPSVEPLNPVPQWLASRRSCCACGGSTLLLKCVPRIVLAWGHS